MIFDTNMMGRELKDLRIDLSKMPLGIIPSFMELIKLGKISLSTIMKGYETLRSIEEALNSK